MNKKFYIFYTSLVLLSSNILSMEKDTSIDHLSSEMANISTEDSNIKMDTLGDFIEQIRDSLEKRNFENLQTLVLTIDKMNKSNEQKKVDLPAALFVYLVQNILGICTYNINEISESNETDLIKIFHLTYAITYMCQTKDLNNFDNVMESIDFQDLSEEIIRDLNFDLIEEFCKIGFISNKFMVTKVKSHALELIHSFWKQLYSLNLPVSPDLIGKSLFHNILYNQPLDYVELHKDLGKATSHNQEILDMIRKFSNIKRFINEYEYSNQTL